jgi:pimeloyl-ACP methyl ester carboxylesterase
MSDERQGEERSRRRIRPIHSVAIVLMLAIGVVVAVSFQKESTAQNWRAKAPGQFVDAAGTSYHVVRAGEGLKGPTVILEAGLTATSTSWAWVQPEVAKFAPVIAYDRAGLGWSDAGERPRDGRQIAKELHALLAAMKLPPPYVLVGHSLGGSFMRVFAGLYPDEVAGLVLIDASPDTALPRSVEQQRATDEWIQALAKAPELAEEGVTPMANGMEPKIRRLPADAADDYLDALSSPSHLETARDELVSWKATQAYVRDSKMPSRPLIVVTAGATARPEWLASQASLAKTSPRGEHRVIAAAEHGTILFDKELSTDVVKAIRDVLNAATK